MKEILTIIVMGVLLLVICVLTLIARNIYDEKYAAYIRIKDRIKSVIPTWIRGK